MHRSLNSANPEAPGPSHYSLGSEGFAPMLCLCPAAFPSCPKKLINTWISPGKNLLLLNSLGENLSILCYPDWRKTLLKNFVGLARCPWDAESTGMVWDFQPLSSHLAGGFGWNQWILDPLVMRGMIWGDFLQFRLLRPEFCSTGGALSKHEFA